MRELGIYIMRLFFVSIIVLVIQLTLVGRIWPGRSLPDLMFVIVLILVIDRDPVSAVIIGFLLGFLQDLGNARLLGMNALANSVTAYGVSRIGRDYLPDSIIFKLVLFIAACLVKELIVLNISEPFSPGRVISLFFRYSLLSALYTSLISVLVWKVMETVSERVVYPFGRR